jgi:hypothetical protein
MKTPEDYRTEGRTGVLEAMNYLHASSCEIAKLKEALRSMKRILVIHGCDCEFHYKNELDWCGFCRIAAIVRGCDLE